MENLKKEIKQLEQWLIEHPDHINVIDVRHNLSLKIKELEALQNTREITFERDTFDIGNYELFKKE